MSSVSSECDVGLDCCASNDDDLASRCGSLAVSDIASSADVSSIASFPVHDVDTSIHLKELKNQLAQLIKSKGQDLIQACKNYDRRSTYRIPKSQLRQVIRMFCLPISAVQFDCLLNELQMNVDGKINYPDFFSQLSSTKVPKATKTRVKVPDNLPIDEVELRIQEKIKNNLRNVIRSFWLFDVNKDGLIQKAELRRIIRNYCFDLSESVFDDLWKSYDPTQTGLVNYKDFLIRLGVSADRYKKYMPSETAATSLCWKENERGYSVRSWEQKCKRAALDNKDDPAIQGLPLEEIIIIFMERIQRQYRVLKDAFKVFDPEGNGEVCFSYFRGVINFFVLAMSTSLFNHVMKKLNIDVSSDKLNYQAFLENFCQPEGQSSDSRKSEKLDVCAPVVQRIKNRVLNPEARLRSVFTKINADQEWQITRPELKKCLEFGLDFKLTDEEFKELTTILDPGNTNVINCVDFIHLFEDINKTNCIAREDPYFDSGKEVCVQKYSHLRGRKLQSKLKHHLNKNLSSIEKAILVCDFDQSGFILPDKLKAILSTFCFPLSDEQFQDVVSTVRKYGNTIHYHEFLTFYKKSHDEDTQKWISMIDKLVNYKSTCPPEMLVTEVEEMIRDCVRSRKTALLKDFKALDVCHVGVVCKDDFRNVLSKFVCRLTDKQFEALWQNFPQNQYNQLLYDQFVEEYSSPLKQPVEDHTEKNRVPEQEQNVAKDPKKISMQETVKKLPAKRKVKLAENRQSTKEIVYSQAPHLKNILEPMEPTMVRNFKTIRYHLRRADPKLTDRVDFVTLKSILAKFNIDFSSEDEFHILEHFDQRLSGRINYRDFLRIFVWYV